jgi:hypothetical protein
MQAHRVALALGLLLFLAGMDQPAGAETVLERGAYLARLTPADLEALIAWLRSLQPIANKVEH